MIYSRIVWREIGIKTFYSFIDINYKDNQTFADKPTHGQSSRALDKSRTGQLPEMFDAKFLNKICDIYQLAGDDLTSPRII